MKMIEPLYRKTSEEISFCTIYSNFKKFPISKLLIGNFLLFFVYCDAEFDSNYFFLDSFIFQLQLI